MVCSSDWLATMTILPKRVDDQTQLSHESIREAEEIFNSHLKRVGLKHTGQRDAILRAFLETHDHLSTEDLHHLVQRSDPSIGFTTVYRTLKLFSDAASPARSPSTTASPATSTSTTGAAIITWSAPNVAALSSFFAGDRELEKEIGNKHHYITTRHTFQIYGVCGECQKKKPARRGSRL